MSAALVFVAGAGAQVPIFPPPGDPATPSGSQPVLAPQGESTAFGGNPSRTGEGSDDEVFGPLKLAWKRGFAGATQEPLIVGGLVIVNSGYGSGDGYGSSLTAMRASNGSVVWRQEIEAVYFDAAIAASDGVVVAADNDGVVRGYRVTDGELLWTSGDGETANAIDSGVVAADGVAYVFGGGRLFAIGVQDGRSIWSVNRPIEATGGIPAIDDGRVFVSADCGATGAFSRATGAFLWSRDGESTCHDGDVVYGPGRVFAADGAILDPVSGAELGQLPAQPAAVSGDLVLSTEGTISARDLSTGGVAWESDRATGLNLRIVGPTVFAVAAPDLEGDKLYGLDSRTGRVVSVSNFPKLGNASTGGSKPGLAVGAGRVFIATEEGVAAMAPRLHPPPGGVDLLPPKARDYYAGTRFVWIAGVGAALRDLRPEVLLEADPAGGGGWSVVDRKRTLTDGGVVLRSKLKRNTRFRTRVEGGEPSRVVKLFAYPRYKVSVRRTSDRFGAITLRVTGVESRTLNKSRAFGYVGRAAQRKYLRLGSARVRSRGGTSGRASIRFRLLKRAGPNDVVAACVEDLPKSGYGRDAGFPKRCGAATIPYPPKKKRARASSVAGAPPAGTSRSHIATSSAASAERSSR